MSDVPANTMIIRRPHRKELRNPVNQTPISTLVITDPDARHERLGTTVSLMLGAGQLERAVIDVSGPPGLLMASAFNAAGAPFVVFNQPSDIGRDQAVHNLLGDAEEILIDPDLDELIDSADALLLVPGLTTMQRMEDDETSAMIQLEAGTPVAYALRRAIDHGRSGMRLVLPPELGLGEVDVDGDVYVRRIHMFTGLSEDAFEQADGSEGAEPRSDD